MKYGTSFLIMLFSILASAAPSSLNYQGRILKTDGSPLSASNVSFSFEITNSDESCVMYREQLNGVDLSTTKGVFDVAVGTGVKQFPLAPSFKLSDAFVDGKFISCDGAAPVTPAIGSSRKLRVQFYEGSTWRSITPAMEIHSVPFAISAAQLDGKEASEFVIKTGLPTCAAGTFLSWDGTALTCQGTVGAGGGTVTSVTSADSYITVTSSTLAPVLQLNVGTTAGTVAAGNDSRIVNALQSGAAVAGDLSGTVNSPTVAKIQGVGVSSTAPTTGQYLKYTGANWAPSGIGISDVTNLTATLSGYQTTAAFNASVAPINACSQSQTVYWNSLSGEFACHDISISSSNITGNIGAAQMPAFSGDATSTAGSTTLTLANSGVAAGTYRSVTVDSKGRVTGGTNPTTIAGYGLTDALNKTGDVMTGALGLATYTDGTESTMTGALTTSDKGKTWFNTTTDQVKYWNGSAAIALGVSGAGLTSLNGLNSSTQNFATGTAGTTLGFSSASGTHTLNIPMASVATVGAGLISNTDYNTFNNKLDAVAGSSLTAGNIWVGNASNQATAVAASGDVGLSNAGAFTVSGLRGTNVSSTTPTTDGQILRFDGTDWTPNFVSMADLRSKVTGTQALTTGCTAAQTLTWISTTDSLACSDIAIDKSQVSFGSQTAGQFFAAPAGSAGTPVFRSIATSDLPASAVTQWTTNSTDIYYNTGKVGIGTTSPKTLLDLQTTTNPSQPVNLAIYPTSSLIYPSSNLEATFTNLPSDGTTTGGFKQITLNPSTTLNSAVSGDYVYVVTPPTATSASNSLTYGLTAGARDYAGFTTTGGVYGASFFGFYAGAGTRSSIVGVNGSAMIQNYNSTNQASTVSYLYGANLIANNSSTNGTVTGGLRGINLNTTNVGTTAAQSGVSATANNIGTATNQWGLNATATNSGTIPAGGIQYGADIAAITSKALDFQRATVSRAVNNSTTGNILSQIGGSFSTENAAAGSVGSQWGSLAVAYNLASGAVTNSVGAAGKAQNYSAGTIGEAIGTQGEVLNNDAGGTITSAMALHGQVLRTAGTITNAYGLYLGAIRGTNQWSIYSADATAPSYFAADVGIGTATPGVKLDVVGAIRTSGALMSDSRYLQFKKNDGTYDNAIYYDNGVTTNDLVIGRDSSLLYFRTNGTIHQTIDADGKVGINNMTPAYQLDVGGDINATGCVRAGGSTLGGTCASDSRLKENIQSFDLGLEALLGITPHYFKYNGLAEVPASRSLELGVIAQEVEKTAPELIVPKKVKLNPDDSQETEIKQVNYTAFTYVLINAVKELYHHWLDDSQSIHRELASKDQQIRLLEQENVQKTKELEAMKKENSAIKSWICSKDPSAALCH